LVREQVTDLTEADIGELADVLPVEDFSGPWLQTGILLDDASGSTLFKAKNSLFNDHLRLRRDDNATYFLTFHGFGTVAPSVK
jgi:hypothetical protein